MNLRNLIYSFARMSALIVLTLALYSCNLNDPYRGEEEGGNTYYSSFSEPPKYLDPARSYFASEYEILAQIYEPLVEYHYLKRPYELSPLTALSVPRPIYYDKAGKRLPPNVSAKRVARVAYDIEIKEAVLYQNHPAFAVDTNGDMLYGNLTDDDLKGIDGIEDFREAATRELTSDDYINQIMRLADPRLHCPILPILENYILGMEELSLALKAELKEVRALRKAQAGAVYNQLLDERKNPIILDYDKFKMPGIERIDDHRFRIILKRKYPQFVYWLAMPFFSPMPREADLFYNQGVLKDKNITIDRYPIGTGAFRMKTFKPQSEMVLAKNENYRFVPYPKDGEAGDEALGLLEDKGKALPFIDEAVYKLEKESIPRWTKFLQGYYDASGISSDSFDQAVNISTESGVELTDFIREKGVSLSTSVRPTTYYTGFNMLDDVVGGSDERKKKLRQAISIVLDYEEFVEIFSNGRGLPAMSPLAPGIFGYSEGKAGINPYVYDWDEEKDRPKRKSLEDARRLMKEAGYPQGRDRNGRPLTISFDNAWTSMGAKQMISWYIKKFKLLGIQLNNKTTDYNRYQEKLATGNFQFYFLGWNADYPDPENFFFLLYGPNGKVSNHGENASNYSSPKFDRLFVEMENMDNSKKRLNVIKDMTLTLQEDAPWVFAYHPVSFTLRHDWVGNTKSNSMANNTLKYLKVDSERRSALRAKWNRPKFLPIVIVLFILIALSIPAVLSIRKKLVTGKRRG